MNLKLSHCGCSCSLQTGTKIICVLDSIGSILTVIVAATEINSILAHYAHDHPDHVEDWSQDEEARFFMLAKIFDLILALFTLIVAGLAMNTAFGNRSEKFLIPWLVVSALSIIDVTVHSFFYIIHTQYEDCFVFLCVTALFSYFWLIVYSFYLEVKERLSTSTIQYRQSL